MRAIRTINKISTNCIKSLGIMVNHIYKQTPKQNKFRSITNASLYNFSTS